jgi:hypothetical protein
MDKAKRFNTIEDLVKGRKESLKPDGEVRESKGRRRIHDDRRLCNPS